MIDLSQDIHSLSDFKRKTAAFLARMRENGRLPEARDFPAWKAERRDWFTSAEETIEELVTAVGFRFGVAHGAEPATFGGAGGQRLNGQARPGPRGTRGSGLRLRSGWPCLWPWGRCGREAAGRALRATAWRVRSGPRGDGSRRPAGR